MAECRRTSSPAKRQRWQLEMAETFQYALRMAERFVSRRGRLERTARRESMLAVALLTALLPQVVAAQAPAARGGQPATVHGIVFDSVSKKPITAASVQLVNADSVSAPPRIIDTDSLGDFRFVDVRPGRYLIAFLHPMLDSIGVESAPRAVTVDGRTPDVRIDLAVPSPQSLRVTICGPSAVADSESLIIGIVRDAATRSAVASSIVDVEWATLTLASGGPRRSTQRRSFGTQGTGWFALCGAPAGGTILLSASHGADSTEALELELPSSGFLRRDLYFGTSRTIAADATPDVIDGLAMPTGPRRGGDGRVSGTVVAAEGGRPLAGARVAIRNGPQTRADERGAFTLSGIPTGTRILDVRAVTYAPLSIPIDVVEGAAPLRIELVTTKSVLDTVKVRANLAVDRNLEGFQLRRKHSGAGRFMTAEEIAQRNAIDAVDILRMMPGVRLARDSENYDILVQRSMSSFENPFCRVAVFVNGVSLRDPTVNDLNGYLRTNQLLGIEMYEGGAAPVEFSKRNGCGSLVIWTR